MYGFRPFASEPYGVALSFPQGGDTAALTGAAVTHAGGAVGVTQQNTVTGQSLSFSQGFISSAYSFTLSGQTNTQTQGTVTPQLVTVVQLSGEAVTLTQGALASAITLFLSGAQAQPEQNNVGATNTIALDAQSVSTASGSLDVVFSAQLSSEQYQALAGTLTPASFSQYPQPSEVLYGVVYGPTFNLVGTLRPGGGGFYRRR